MRIREAFRPGIAALWRRALALTRGTRTLRSTVAAVWRRAVVLRPETEAPRPAVAALWRRVVAVRPRPVDLASRTGGLRRRLAALRPTTVALTIEHGSIKVLEADGRQVLRYALVPVNPNFFREGLVSRPSRVGRVVGAALMELGHGRHRVVAAAPGFQSTLRVVELPRTRRQDLDVLLSREAGAALGVALDRSVVRWHRLADWQERRRWLVTATARRSVDAVLGTARYSSLTVDAMEQRPFALARAVNRREAVIAWAANDGADVVVVRDAVPVAYQPIFWGADLVEGDVLVERLTHIVERTLGVAEERDPLGWIGEDAPIYVSGSPVGLESGLGLRVAESLGRPLGELAPPMAYPEEMPLQDFVVNVGLALGEA